MDGLTIRTGQRVLESGKTFSELNTKKITPKSSNDDGVSFVDTLKEAVNTVNRQQQDADTLMKQLAAGETSDIAGVKLATEKADISLRLMTSVRNKVIDAYQEIMKMQV